MELILTKISHPASRTENPNSKIPDPASRIPHPASIKNLIFDFGGVIINIDPELTKKQFTKLGFNGFDTEFSKAVSIRLFEDIETGTITPQQFRDGLKKFFPEPVSDAQIDDAWNILLLDIPVERIRLLENLRKQFHIFLLSNSNEIHYHKYFENLRMKYGYSGFDELFEKAYFSYQIGLKKPDPEIFRYVLKSSRLIPAETLFIDDSLQHVEGARAEGIHAHHLQIDLGEQITDLFEE